MRRIPLPLRAHSALLLALATGCGDSATAPDTFPALEVFDRFWAAFDSEYSYFEYKRINWDSLGEVYRVRAPAVASYDDMVPLLREMVQPMRDVHVSFTSPSGEHVPSWLPPYAINWDQQTWSRHVTAHQWAQRPNWGSARFGDIGYLAFGGWGSGIDTLAVDAVLDALRDLPALIIDVRPNGGGDSRIALRVAGRFATTRTHFQSVRFREGPRHSDFGPLIDAFVEPRGPWQYSGPVVVLTGRAAFSSNEAFIAAMRELPHVTLIGDTTGGSSGNPATHSLGGGWTFRVPRWIATLVDGTVIEWNGIPPDVPLDTGSLTFGGATDPVIDFALAWLAMQPAAAVTGSRGPP